MVKPRIAITGCAGYIGRNLGIYLQKKGYSVCGIDNRLSPTSGLPPDGLHQADITNPEEIQSVLSMILPDIVVHTAGLSDLKKCESSHELALRTNVEGTRNIVNWIRDMAQKPRLLFMSSDYVFDGERGDYREDDVPNPQTFYGMTKLTSENDISSSLDDYIICRSAGVYGRGGNFFKFVSESIAEGREIEVFRDVQSTPTYIDYLLDCLGRLIEQDFRGVIHVAGRERVSRYEFALAVAEVLGRSTAHVRPVRQPPGGLISKDSSLNSEYVRKLLGNYSPTIEKSLLYCFGDLIAPYFYFSDDRGRLVGVTQGRKWEEVNYVESAQGSVRGNHYHRRTVEGFYIIGGSIKVSLLDVTSNSKREFRVGAGDFFVVQPNVLHTFEVLEDAKWINMLSRAMNEQRKDIRSAVES